MVGGPRSFDDGFEEPGDGDPACHGFEPSAVAASADLPGRLDADVPDLARHAVAAAVWLAAQDEAGADSCGKPDVDHVSDAAPGAEDLLAKGAHVGVVGKLYGDAEPVLQLGRRRDAVPARQDAVGLDLAGALIDGRGRRPGSVRA